MSGDTLRIEDLHLSFKSLGHKTPVLRGVDLRIRPGALVALVGESGSGKSVMAQAAIGLLPRSAAIDKGKILFRERASGTITDLAQLKPSSVEYGSFRGSHISMVFQEPMSSLSPLHTVGDQVGEAYSTHFPATRAQTRDRTIEMLASVGFADPAGVHDMYPFELSGGMRQRAMIAMALICEPELLIADEPTTALDVTVQAQILKLLKAQQRERQTAMLLITHDLGVVANMADEVFVMYHGEIMEMGPVDAIFSRPQHPYLKALMAAVPTTEGASGGRLVPLREQRGQPRNATVGQPQTPELGSGPEDAKPCHAGLVLDREAPVLEIKGVTKSFVTSKGRFLGRRAQRRVTALNDVSLQVRQGECLGLVGESGCGKSTLSKLIMRALTPDSGEIVLHETDDRGAPSTLDIASAGPSEIARVRSRIQMVFQDPVHSLSPRMTVRNIISEPLEIARIGTAESQRDTAAELMRTVGLDPRMLTRYPHSFSGGQRQRIGIARALALTPKLLILDEPVSALDVSVQAQILNLLNDLRRAHGLSYLFIAHNLAVVHYVADRIAVMARGRVVEIASRDQLFANPTHPYTRALLKAIPFADLARPINFDEISDQTAADPANWGRDYAPAHDGGCDLVHLQIEAGHSVLARPSARIAEVA